MLSGAVMLVFTPLVHSPAAYLRFFIFAQVFYGVGVGGEYPMAASSAAERSQSDPALRQRRGEQVVLTFSQQGMGSLVNCSVILILMALAGQTGQALDPTASRNIIILQVWKAEREDAVDIAHTMENKRPHHLYRTVLREFGPRLVVTCLAWMAANFAFYGAMLFQAEFFTALYPTATPFQRLQWTALNSGIALLGYWAAAALVDKPWYGRRKMQAVGFFMVAALCMACGAGYHALTASTAGYHAFQALYFLSSFFNQFGPNCTTWLVAAEVFPTDVRTTFQGASAAWGKIGAIIADIVFGIVRWGPGATY
ncbi:Inorganic phosphate transporter PHO84 [Monoraphidium neglectum]|uniref:Inorganic phosphate transporter PHO84 n=1 Tax=Monoraphidium neglectum TaxID=145388 RepID=A0A0D2N0D1_9CHLO|nr:Inorganic phosphate transporter PHO84 [Monoraphidium neglectum]KIZ06012.1 Inorganic phosphate transporter PHO84 [Monoraphidium neglectum]|eukprot:XP_013905031.1 Inorganic phosphate transporter PHO84 [Monoraphidium neglectum]